MRELIESVRGWADSKGLLGRDKAERQTLKMVSEVGEFCDEVAKGTKEKQLMEMGDVLVTCIITSHNLGFDIEHALETAWEKISKRTGKTIDGVFVKD